MPESAHIWLVIIDFLMLETILTYGCALRPLTALRHFLYTSSNIYVLSVLGGCVSPKLKEISQHEVAF